MIFTVRWFLLRFRHIIILLYAVFSLAVVGTGLDLSLLSAHQSQTQWTSVTLRRVNLRQNASIRSTVKTVLNEGTSVNVISETTDWLFVSTVSGDSGWVYKEFVASKTAIEQQAKTQGSPSTRGEPAKKDTISVSKSEFAVEREPENIAQNQKIVWGNLIRSILLILSIIVNIILFFRIFTQRRIPRVLGATGDSNVLANELDQLKRTNADLKNQLITAEEKRSKSEATLIKTEKEFHQQKQSFQQEITNLKNKINQVESTLDRNIQSLKEKDTQIDKLTQEAKNLTKDLENIQKQLNKTTENIQQQAIKFTLSEQTHKEDLRNKENELKRLQEQLDIAQHKCNTLEKENAEKSAELKKHNESLIQKVASLEKSLEAKNKELTEQTAQIRKEYETSIEEKVEARITTVTDSLKKQYEREKETLSQRSQREIDSLNETIRLLQQHVSNLEKSLIEERQLRIELETKTADFDTITTTQESALKDLQKEYTTLLSLYEDTQQPRVLGIQTKPIVPLVREELQIEPASTEEIPAPVKESVQVKQVIHPAKREQIIQQDKQLNEYARNFFKKIRQIE